MTAGTKVSPPVEEITEDALWTDLYTVLEPLTRSWTYSAHVPTWKGQEWDVAQDITQMTLLKFFLYLRKSQEQGTPIHSYRRLCLVIAKHTFIDLRRQELRLRHFTNEATDSYEGLSIERLVDPSQEAEERIYEEWALVTGAATIATFSTKLRAAILVDLAHHSSFTEEPSILQQALLAAGINLQDYQRAPSPDPAERGRESTLRSLAYKRLAQAHIV